MADTGTAFQTIDRSLSIEWIALKALAHFARNARTHSKKQIRQIADSIREFGFTNPVLIDDENTILAGHGRVAAAKLLGLELVPCLRISGLTTAQKRALVLADNKLALNAGWDEELLAEELQTLLAIDDLGFDIGTTGFSIAEIDTLIEARQPVEPGDPAEDRLPELERAMVVSRPGDLWELGRHRLICGNALDNAVFDRMLAGEKAEMVFTDPPYNVPIAGHAGGAGKIKHGDFVMASGEMSGDEFTAFLKSAFANLVRHSINGSIHYVCMDWRHMAEILSAGQAAYSELKNLCVWVKDNGGLGSFYRSRHELIFAFKAGTAAHLNSFGLGQHGRYRTNVWQYRGVNTLKAERMEELMLHPTVKPVQMIADATKDVSRRNGIVLDSFAGSGSTLIAAHKCGRRAYLIELDPLYVDRIIRRWQIYAKDDAVLAETGETFATVQKARAGGDRA